MMAMAKKKKKKKGGPDVMMAMGKQRAWQNIIKKLYEKLQNLTSCQSQST